MKIVMDLQGLQTGSSRCRGIGRYTSSLVKGIIKNRGEHEIILFLGSLDLEIVDDIIDEFSQIINKKNIKVCHFPTPVHEADRANFYRKEVSERIRENFLFNLRPDFVLVTSLFEGFGEDFVCSINQLHNIPTAVVFYDLIPFMNKELYLANVNALRWYENKISQCENAQLLLSISEFSKEEGIKYLNFNSQNIINISTAADDSFQILDYTLQEEKEIRKKFKLSKSYLMYSGATDDRKNHLRLIEAFSLLPIEIKNENQLVIVGGMPIKHETKFKKYAKKYGLTDEEFIITGEVTDREMALLYNISKAFVFPSWYEGFGLPALEAMQCGKAVIASNTSSLPEVVGLNEALFNPFDVQDISNKINKVLSDMKFRILLEKHSVEQAKQFSWDITSKRAILAMENYHKQNFKIIESYDALSHLIKSIGAIDIKCNNKDILLTSKCIYKNYYRRHLFVDISELVQNDHNTGIQRVTKNILMQLLSNNIETAIVVPVYATQDKTYSYANNFVNQILKLKIEEHEDTPVNFIKGDIFLCLDMSPPLNIKYKNFYQKLKQNGVNVHFVVYDILPILCPSWWDKGVAEDFESWLNIVLESTSAICISQQTNSDLSKWIKKTKYDLPKNFQIKFFGMGVENNNVPISMKSLEEYSSTLKKINNKISFLMVATLEPRKGHNQVIEAFEKLWKNGQDINLVIVGKRGWLVDKLVKKLRTHNELNKHLYWLEGVNDEYLEKIYEFSNCLIAASEGEGFGLPLVEAAKHKLPIIARDIPVFKEVAGEHAYYYKNNKDSKVISNAIVNWLQLYKQNKHPKSDYMPLLTWKESMEQLLVCLNI